nr:hypothetical protein [Tanacetum cinerariifolium]
MIHGSVKASKIQSMQEAIEFATEMMDKKMLTHAERQAEHKRKFDDTSRNTQHQQQLFKRNNVERAYTDRPGDKKPYGGTKPLCRPAATNNNNNNQNNNNNKNHMAQGANARGITCFECGVQGHYKSDCPKLKNGNQRNRAGNRNVVAREYAVGTVGTNPNSNIVMGRLAAANNNNNNNKKNNNNNQKAQGVTARGITCYECGVLGYYKSDCLKLKNGNPRNRAGNGNAMARVYAIGTAGTNPN